MKKFLYLFLDKYLSLKPLVTTEVTMWLSAPVGRNVFSRHAQKLFPPKLSSNVKLVGAQIVHRHGDRTPINAVQGMDDFWNDQIPSDESVNHLHDKFPMEGIETSDLYNSSGIRGRLTHRGLQQLNAVGKQIQEDYTKAHGQALRPDQVQVHCTTFLRTVQSVQSLLDGLFDGTGDDSSTQTPIKSIQALNKIDPFGVMRARPEANDRMNSLLQSEETKEFNEKVTEFMESILSVYHDHGILDPKTHSVGFLCLVMMSVSSCNERVLDVLLF